jgi:DNA-binding NarL/FixJ family response regulator
VTTIILAEDHNLVREGLKHLLRNDKTLKLVGEAEDGLKALELVEAFKPDILLLDLMIPRLHGLEVIRQVQKFRHTKVIVVSMHSDEPYVLEAFRNGALGYVLKDSTPGELLQAIRLVANGSRFLSPALSDLAIHAYLKRLDGIAADIYSTLSARERVVLQLAAEGHSTAEIAKQLYISPRTVETHRANFMKKLSLRSQTDLVRFAIRKKIIEA